MSGNVSCAIPTLTLTIITLTIFPVRYPDMYHSQPILYRDGLLIISQFNGTSTPKGSYRAKTGDNDCNVNSSRYNLRTALCESIRYQAKSEQNVRQDLISRVRHVGAAECTPR